MKKLIFIAAVLASVFFAASCQQEMLDPQAERTTVTYTVEVPDAIATKAIGDEITAVDKVYYEVYRAGEVESGVPVYEGVEPLTNNQASFDLDFVKDQEFVVLFWAQNSSLVKTADNPGGMYEINDLRAIKLVNPGASNNAAAQVFAGKDTVDDCVSDANGDVTLTRPVSQINVYTTTESLSFGNMTIGLDKSSMTVAGLYNTFNVATGDAVVSDENKATFVYTEAAVPAVLADKADLKYVAMNYVGFAPKVGTTTTVDFTIKTTTEAEPIEHTVSNVPVKPNYRTNIVGNLISATTDYNLTLNNNWWTPDTNVEVVAVSTAQDLQDAIDNIQAGGAEGNIILEGDIDLGALFGASTLSVTKAGNAQLPIVILENKAVTLDLNGFTITTPWEDETAGKHYYAFDNKGTLNIVDSKANGKIKARGIFNYGIMTLESGSIEACDGNGGYGVRNYEGAEFVMNGGSIVTSNEDDHQVNNGGYDATTLRVDEGATATINGGTINNICDYTFAIDNYGTTTVNGGTFESVHSTVSTYGTMAINGGSFICDGIEGITAHCLVAWDGSQTTINGGIFNGKDNYNGFNVDTATGATVYIKGGEFLPVHSGSLYGDGTIIVTGGTFFDKVSEKYLAAGYSCQQNEEGKWIVPQVALAKIGEVSYPTLAAAIDAVSEDAPATITVQAAVFTEESIVIPAGKSITLDLNGMTIIGEMHKSVGAVVKNEGTLTIKNGTISSTAANGGSAIANNGTLAVEKATLNGAGHADGQWPSYTVNNTGVMTATETKITSYHGALASYGEGAEATLIESEIDMAGIPGFTSHGIYTYSGGKVVVNGGTYANKATDQASSGASVINGAVEVNAGTFTGRIENYYGTPVLKGGTYSVKPSDNYLADGYKVIKNEDGKFEVLEKTYVAQIGEQKYESLQEAFNAVKTSETITILKDLTDVACYYNGTVSFTLDLNYKTLTSSNHTHMFEFNWNQVAETTPVTINITNGTLISGENTKWTIYSEDTNNVKGTFNLTNLTIDHNMPNYGAVVAGIGNTFNAVNVDITTSYGIGFYAAGGEVVMNECSATVQGLHLKPYNSMAFAVCANGKMTINSGEYSAAPVAQSDASNQGTSHGSWCGGIMSSGGELIINGGTFSNDNFGDNSLATYARSCIMVDAGGKLLINGGEFNALKNIIYLINNIGDPKLNPTASVTGGKFSNNPTVFDGYGNVVIPDGKSAVEGADGRWTIQ